MSIDFDKCFFRPLDYVRIWIKCLLTKLRLRDIQSCKHCGRDQWMIWTVKDELWLLIPKKYQNKAICLECFICLCPVELSLENFDFLDFPPRYD